MRVRQGFAAVGVFAILLGFAAIAYTDEPECRNCNLISTYVKIAVERGDRLALIKLKHDLARIEALSEADRSHLFAFIDEAITQVPDAEMPTVEYADLRENAAAQDNGETDVMPADVGFALNGNQPESNESANDLAEPPAAEDTGLDYCRRVVRFAKLRNDVYALEALEAELPLRADLTDRSRATVQSWIDAFRATSESPESPSAQAATGPSGFALVQPAVPHAVPHAATPSPNVVSGAPAIPAAPVAGGANLQGVPERNVNLHLPAEADTVFSDDYRRLRRRYLDFFLFEGMTANELRIPLTGDFPTASPNDPEQTSVFGDQGLHMGQALLTFAVESRLLNLRGLSSAPSEAAIAQLLDGFDEMDAADDELNGDTVEGYYMRDAVKNDEYLFSAGAAIPDHVADLNNNVVNAWLGNEFQSNNRTLTQAAQISIVTRASEWRIIQDRQAYTVRNEGGTLNVYKYWRHGIPWNFESDLQKSIDSLSARAKNGVSLDQITSLAVGWWAVSNYSSSTANVERARRQADRVMKFLIASNFRIRLRDGTLVTDERGGDCRFAAGFLCQIATRTTGKPYLAQAQIELTEVSGKTIRFRDDNLGEFEIPEYKFPLTMPVALSHPGLLGNKAAVLSTLSTPSTISIRLTDLIPEANHELTLPCAHLTAAHPGGDKVTTPCIHMTAQHPGGDAGPNVPCTHLTPRHPGGHDVPCTHMTAAHPGGDAGPVAPCTHIVKLHDKDTIQETVRYPCPTPTNPGRTCTRTISTDVPCTHFGPQHPGGHPTRIPCVHLVPAHPGGHNVPCVHMTAAHPAGHTTTTPCIHLVPAHPGGHETTTPCIHIEPAHSGGHKFDLGQLNVEIPLFANKDKSFARHIMLQCLAFEPAFSGAELIPPAVGSDHSWSMLLRLHAMRDMPPDAAAAKAAIDLHSFTDGFGPSGKSAVPWAKGNRWERCTDLQPTGVSSSLFNGLDYMSLEGMTLLIGSP